MFKKEKMGNRNWNEIYLIWQMIEEKRDKISYPDFYLE